MPHCTHFILYSRSYCHLCQDMLDALQAFSAEFAFSVEVVDIDAAQDAALLAKYDELVPVLLGRRSAEPSAEALELCHYFLDGEKIREFLHCT